MSNEVVSQEIVKAKFNIALDRAQVGIQLLHDAESKLVYTEDNLQAIADFISKCKKASKVIADEHKALKEPALRECQSIDESKRAMDFEVNDVLRKAQQHYTKIATDINTRRIEQERENQRVSKIKSGINNNVIHFSEQIANCKSALELTSIEKLINLEKTYKLKYQEFLPEAIERFNGLNSLIKDQKSKTKEWLKISTAEQKTTDQEELLELQQKKEEIETAIDENKISVQEQAINHTTKAEIPVAQEVLPDLKPRRTTWEWEVKDIKETQKKMPGWVELLVNDTKVDEYLKAKKQEGIAGEEFTFAGIRFYLKKTW